MTSYQVRSRKQKPKPGVLNVRRSRTGDGYEVINSIGQVKGTFDTEDEASAYRDKLISLATGYSNSDPQQT